MKKVKAYRDGRWIRVAVEKNFIERHGETIMASGFYILAAVAGLMIFSLIFASLGI